MNLTGVVVKSRRVVLPEGIRPAAITISEGRIIGVGLADDHPPGYPVFDYGERAVLPGLVDTHVHVNEPGRSDWEGFETATRAAAAGGVTTIVDMPLNSEPATTTAAALAKKIEAARHRLWVDCGFWGGAVPGNEPELESLHRAGVLGFKAFLVDSGIDDFPRLDARQLEGVLGRLAPLDSPLLVHAELAPEPIPSGSSRRYGLYLGQRPKSWENQAVELVARLCQKTSARAHIVHVSSSEALPLIAAAKSAGARLTAETCPHYLYFSAEEILDGRTEFKCSPPIRERQNGDGLWQGLKDGTLDFVVSDHSPCAPHLKRQGDGDFFSAWGGISSLQFSLPATWTAARERGLDLENLVAWMCERPASFAGLSRKGRIAPGFDADLCVFDPEETFAVKPQIIRHRHEQTAYLDRTLSGKVEACWLRGELIYGKSDFPASPRGKLLLRC